MDLTQIPILGRFVHWKHNRTFLQSLLLLGAFLILYDGFFGPQIAPKNLAGSLPWVHWRGFIVLALLIFGNLFCMACPFMLPRKIAKKIFPASLRFPIQTKWLAIVALVFFFWAYEAFDLWASPLLTAWVAVAYFLLAFFIDGFFKGAPFCKYICPIGQFHFVNSTVSPMEVKVKNEDVCAECTTLDCIKGRQENGTIVQSGCELFLFQPKKTGNLDCTFCLDCVKACPKKNVGIITRKPLMDTWSSKMRSGVGVLRLRTDYAVLALMLVFGAFLNAFGMIPPVYRLEKWLAGILQTSSEPLILVLIFIVGLGLIPFFLVGIASCITKKLSKSKKSLREIGTLYSFTLIPVGFGMWMSHYLFHFLTGALGVLSTIQEFFSDFGVTFFEQFNWNSLGPLVPETWVIYIVILFQGFGMVGSLYAILSLSRQEFQYRKLISSIPWIFLVVALFIVGYLIMMQPMEMRGVVL